MSKQIALVTGGSSGIGRSLCLKLAKEGYRVYSASRSQSLPDDMASITQISVDFSLPEQSSIFAQEFIDQYGVPDLLVNNAGYGAFYEWVKFPNAEITKQIDVLFSSPLLLCRNFAPSMQKEGRGVILNLSSLATLYPLPYMPLYNATKSALSSFTESLMLEYCNFPKLIDFRMGDVCTNFNNSSSKQSTLSRNSNAAWKQIEKQLKNSIGPEEAANQIYRCILKMRTGTYYGGGFFHRFILPNLRFFLPFSFKNFLIRKWYNLIGYIS